jgi:hypothetical protein
MPAGRHNPMLTGALGGELRVQGIAPAAVTAFKAARWRCVNAPHFVALVRAGARLERGMLVERHDQAAA